MAGDEQLRDLEERYEGYTVYDKVGDKIGKVDDLFVDETDREEYIGVKMGLFGLSGTTLIPMDVVRVDERRRAMEVSESKEHVKDAPNFGDDDDITPEYEDRIRRHFGLGSLESSTARGSYGRGITDRVGQESYRNREDVGAESAMGSAGTATPSGGVRDLETGGVEDEGFREGYREGFREGYQEALQEGGEPGVREGIGSATEATDLGRGERQGGREGARSAGAPEDRDREPGGRGDLGASDRDRDLGEREGDREGIRSSGASRDLDRGERREESTSTKVWRRIRG